MFNSENDDRDEYYNNGLGATVYEDEDCYQSRVLGSDGNPIWYYRKSRVIGFDLSPRRSDGK